MHWMHRGLQRQCSQQLPPWVKLSIRQTCLLRRGTRLQRSLNG
jgi:hypothetical protein